jgi:DNA-binding NtrC family response regulator
MSYGTFVSRQGEQEIPTTKEEGGIHMIRTDLLRGRIAQKGTSQRKLAMELGITEKTFYQKMKKGVFSSEEIYQLVEILGIEDLREVFFAKDIAL